MFETNKYVDIILPLPVRGNFTYALPVELEEQCEIGMRVLVSFGKKRLYTGIVHRIHSQKPEDFEVKPILEVMDKFPVINKYQLRLWEWCSDYYMSAMGDFYKAALPSGLRIESETKVVPNPEAPGIKLESDEQLILSVLKNQLTLSVGEIGKMIEPANPIRFIKRLIEKELVLVQEQLKLKYKPKIVKTIALHESIRSEKHIEETIDGLKRAKKQWELFQFILNELDGDYFSDSTLDKRMIVEKSGLSASLLKSLVDKKVLVENEVEGTRLVEKDLDLVKPKELNEHQHKALGEIQQIFSEKDTVLLHGVTSSGKTEIFIHLIQRCLERGEQVLYLLPEIALTSQIIHRLRAVFGNQIGVYHSKFSDAERVEIYKNLQAGGESAYKIILGVRSSIFLPFSNLGLVIVDEEHENTYKQFDPSPRYNARDLSVVLAKLHKTKVLLGTATPSIESYYNALTGRYGLVELFSRYKDIKLPEIIIADTLKAKKKKQMQSHFSPELMNQIDDSLSKNEQVILFQNRRGFSPFVECNDCGWVPKCKFCDVSLTYHKGINKLVCHYCGYSVPNAHHCGKCGKPEITSKGFGTEKVEDDVSLIFHNSKVGRLDLDTAKGKHGHEKIIMDFQNQKLDILIGTQMVSKGLDFDHVNVVGILNADSMLGYPDFRAFERSYQLMAQVAGRAGRKNRQGKVVIQTYNPEHPIIKQVQNNRYDLMYNQQLTERKQFFYPPFSRLIRITLKHRDNQVLTKASVDLAMNYHELPDCKVLGPTTPVVMRIQSMYIKQILIKLSRTQNLSSVKQRIWFGAEELRAQPNYKSVQVIFDVDPM